MNRFSASIARALTSTCLAAGALALASCGGGNGGLTEPDSSPVKKFVIALKANKNPEKMLEEKENLQKYLTEKLGREVEVVIPSASSAIVEGFKGRTIDLGYLSSTDAARNLDEEAGSILFIHLKGDKPNYDSVWLTSADGNYSSIDDLAGHPVAFASPTSTSGRLIPTWDLVKRGHVGPEKALTDFFSEVKFATGYVSAVQLVLDGHVEAAAVSDYVFLGDKYLDDEQKAKLKILQKQGPVPSHTICHRKTLSKADLDLLRQTLLAMNEDNPDLRDSVFNGELVEVDPEEHLKVTREALEVQKTIKE